MAHGDRIDEDRIDAVVEAAVGQGQAPGVVAAVARGLWPTRSRRNGR